MLRITVPGCEMWDEENNVFVTYKDQVLQLEHSLVSLSKWESKWCTPFFSKKEKTDEEMLDYIRCMTITQNVSPDTYLRLTEENIKEIYEYIEAPMTAYNMPKDKKATGGRETIIAELIRYWMITLNIPCEYEKWHLNRLLALIDVCNVKNTPPKKRSRREIMSRNKALNDARRQQLNTRG